MKKYFFFIKITQNKEIINIPTYIFIYIYSISSRK